MNHTLHSPKHLIRFLETEPTERENRTREAEAVVPARAGLARPGHGSSRITSRAAASATRKSANCDILEKQEAV